jgi:hypothetical protein
MTQPGIPSSTESSRQHTNSDLDASSVAQHHTLGTQHNQASPGDHKHDGKNSKLLGKGKDLSFPTTANAAYTQAQLQSVINALRNLGFGS